MCCVVVAALNLNTLFFVCYNYNVRFLEELIHFSTHEKKYPKGKTKVSTKSNKKYQHHVIL